MSNTTNPTAADDAPTDELRVDVDRYDISPACTQQEFLAVVRIYARAVAEAHDLSVSVSDLEWDVSKRAKRRAGAVKHRNGEPLSVVLTWEQFERKGWRETAATIRHELLHVHLLNEANDPSHGPAFQRLADAVDTHVHCDRFAEPKWWVRCGSCGLEIARYRRSKLVKRPDRYACGDCGGSLRVEPNE
ncbi:MAG: SprT-like domain-containing protein [Halobacteriota archaeon]